tara:strand:- start:371 stop:538 length:168 start_codon:yes stop_codon:yes gene_type:complete
MKSEHTHTTGEAERGAVWPFSGHISRRAYRVAGIRDTATTIGGIEPKTVYAGYVL